MISAEALAPRDTKRRRRVQTLWCLGYGRKDVYEILIIFIDR